LQADQRQRQESWLSWSTSFCSYTATFRF